MRYQEIKKALVDSLKALFPEERVYGTDTAKGFNKPCIFVSLTTELIEGTKNVMHKGCYIELIRMQTCPDEAEALAFFEKIERAFYPKLRVGDRHLTTESFETDFMGDEENIPRIEFYTEYYQDMEKPVQKIETLKKFRIKEELR